jgi:hypothetical protein
MWLTYKAITTLILGFNNGSAQDNSEKTIENDRAIEPKQSCATATFLKLFQLHQLLSGY